jgi:predicted enzyme related to lactoylglutathione lyase
MENTSYESGTPCWLDIGAADPASEAAFYSELFGWQAGEADAGGYRLLLLGGKPVAGISPRQADVPTRWTTFVSVADAEATTARVLVAGGEVHLEPTDVTDEGRVAVYSDSTGATFSVWQPKTQHGSAMTDEPGTMCWHELGTRNPIAAVDFYRQVFDWVAATEEMGGRPYTIWRLGEHAVAGMVEMDDSWPAEAPAAWLPYFAVDDCEAAIEKVSAGGGRTLAGPRDVAPGRFAVVADPEGAPFAVMRLG